MTTQSFKYVNLLPICAFALISVLASCKKNKPIPLNDPNIAGTYEWSWSIDTTGNIIESSNSTDNYGVLVENEGYIYTYKNGEKVERYLFHDYFTQWGKTGVRCYIKIRKNNKIEEQFVFLYFENEIQIFHWPFEGSTNNYFYKVE